MTLQNPKPIHYRNQRGAVLFVALVFLVLLTLLALTAMNASVLQERMTGGMRNSQLSLMGAETGARGVEWSIWNLATTSNKLNCGYAGGTNTCYGPTTVAGPGSTTVLQMNPNVTAFRNVNAWSDAAAVAGTAKLTNKLTGLTGTQQVAALSDEPRYMIEQLGAVLPPGVNSAGEGGAIYGTNGRSAGNLTLYAYRITARSPGGSDASTRAVETYFVALPPTN
jgi:type IV pilus assembly protein PilX